jgi:peptide deformylase
MVLILQKEEKTLYKKSTPVAEKDIKSPKIRKIISEMKKALHQEEDGVAIAAPQIGVPLSIFVVSHRVFDIIDEVEPEESNKRISKKDLVFINPKISKLSKEKEWMEEGCLSVRWLYGKVNRSKKAKVTAYNEQGVKFEMGASGLLAQVFQHEVDHLNGVLFIDKAKEVHDLPPVKK